MFFFILAEEIETILNVGDIIVFQWKCTFGCQKGSFQTNLWSDSFTNSVDSFQILHRNFLAFRKSVSTRIYDIHLRVHSEFHTQSLVFHLFLYLDLDLAVWSFYIWKMCSVWIMKLLASKELRHNVARFHTLPLVSHLSLYLNQKLLKVTWSKHLHLVTPLLWVCIIFKTLLLKCNPFSFLYDFICPDMTIILNSILLGNMRTQVTSSSHKGCCAYNWYLSPTPTTM